MPRGPASPADSLTDKATLLVRNFARAFGQFWEGYFQSPHGC